MSRKRLMLLLILAVVVLLVGGAGKGAVRKDIRVSPCQEAAGMLIRGLVSDSPAAWSGAAQNNPLWLLEISAD